MDATRWQMIRALFDELIELEPSAWEQALQSRHPEDAELREEVLEMLRVDVEVRGAPSRLADRSPELLGEMADADDAQQVQGWLGKQLGAWRIVRPLGRGGMGMVYLAEREDGQFRQQAAIKLLRVHDDDGGMQRFLAERQILAGLDHPNIAHLLDGGRGSDGVPWFALEYVDGTSLTAWCDAHKLDIRNRLKLFMSVCAAVSYAHERLVIHRDLKPANILVDKEGQVKLLDFGIAKLIDADTSSTATAARVFTPEYAAPEQVRGERMTTAVDVYSLGVVLYELLTGRRPYRLAEVTGRALERAIVDQVPSRPSLVVGQSATSKVQAGVDTQTDEVVSKRSTSIHGLRSSLRGDLDAIVLKALRKEPERRYGSVRELSQDLQAYFDRRPVAAHSGGWRYTFDRFMRRNALAVGFAGLAFLALTAGLMVALVQANEARKQRDNAQAEAAKATQALGFMTDLFKLADPGAGARTDLTARDLLDEGARNIRFAFAEQPASRMQMLLAMATAYLSIYLPGPADDLIKEAEGIASSANDPVAMAEVAVVRCYALTFARQNDECARLSRTSERRLDSSDATQSLLVVELISARIPGLFNDANYAEAERELVRAITLLNKNPADTRQRWALATELVFAMVGQGRYADAEKSAREILGEMRGSPSARPRDIAFMLGRLAETLHDPDRNDERLALLREALEKMEEIYGPDHPAQISRMNNLATALYRAGQISEAIPMIQRVVEVRRKHFGEAHPSTGQATVNLAAMMLGAGDDAGALVKIDEAIAILEQSKRSPILGSAYLWRASIMLLVKRFEEAEVSARQAHEVISEFVSEENSEILRVRTVAVAVAAARAATKAELADACAEAEKLVSQYAASDERESKEASFVNAIGAMCRVGTAEEQRVELDRLIAIVPKHDPKARHARLVQESIQKLSSAGRH